MAVMWAAISGSPEFQAMGLVSARVRLGVNGGRSFGACRRERAPEDLTSRGLWNPRDALLVDRQFLSDPLVGVTVDQTQPVDYQAGVGERAPKVVAVARSRSCPGPPNPGSAGGLNRPSRGP